MRPFGGLLCRFARAFAPVVVALALLPAAGVAATRYAEATGGGDELGCPQAHPCTLTNAFAGDGGSNQPSDGDVIVAEPGTYSVSTNLEGDGSAVTLEGEPGQQRPVIEISGSGQLAGGGSDTNFSNLAVDGTSSQGELVDTYGGTLSGMVISGDIPGTIVCQCYDGTIADSVVVNTAAEGGAVGINSNGGGATESYHNDTFYVTEANAAPFLILADGSPAASAALAFTAQNVIFANGGGGDDIAIHDDGTGDETTSATLTVAHSDYDPSKVAVDLTGGATGGVTAGAGNVSAAPGFVEAGGGDFHELAGSPTIGAGLTDATDDGSVDFDGLPRTTAGLTDMGAFEYQPLGTARATASVSTAATGAPVTFTGAGSDPNPGAGPLTYTWHFDDGATATGASVAHAFTTAGVHTATLTVGDGSPLTATASASVTVEAPRPATPAPVSILSLASGSVTAKACS
jgi:PKD repeat protein